MGWTGLGYPLTWTGLGYPSQVRMWYPPPAGQNSRASTYVEGGMPLAFTQEDFLVINMFDSIMFYVWYEIDYMKSISWLNTNWQKLERIFTQIIM